MKNFIKALNEYIQDEYNLEGRFLQTNDVKQDTNFKVFKHCLFNLYYVTDTTSLKVVSKDLMVKEDSYNKDAITIQLMKEVIKYLGSPEFKDLVDA